MIKFNIPLVTGYEKSSINSVLDKKDYAGDGSFTHKTSSKLNDLVSSEMSLLTPSCTHALELAALLCNIKKGDEVIMPSYTFVSTANAFALRGAKIVFVDVSPETMNLDLELVKESITSKTKVIVPVHYAGTSCDMDYLMAIAKEHDLIIVEDAAQGINSFYKKSHLGSIGHLGCLSFHETKNMHCGEGGALLVNSKEFIERAEIIRQKGTNRNQFIKGIVDKYTWVELGSSYLMNELSAAFLYGQIEGLSEASSYRLKLWDRYEKNLLKHSKEGYFEILQVPKYNSHNGHIFYLKLKSLSQRDNMLEFLKHNRISAVFHYIPLHTSNPGLKHGIFNGTDRYTTSGSEQLVRLPMHNCLSLSDIDYISSKVIDFFIT